MNKASIQDLLDKYLTESLTAEEMKQFKELLESEEQDQLLEARLKEIFDEQLKQEYHLPEIDQRMEEYVMSRVTAPQQPRYRRIPLYRRVSRPLAAAVLLLLISTGGYYIWSKQRSPVVSQEKKSAEVQPGKKGAILTLADGKQVQLDTLENTTIALQGGQVVKVQNGELVYSGDSKEVVYNSVITPKGRQFKLSLPDGTKVWLNAASSIRYPLTFNGKDRKITLTGEGYFEVSHDADHPFVVDVNGKAVVEVLGTGFNIKAYDNEAAIAATLLEGKIKVSSTATTGSVVLDPGQQAILNGNVNVKVVTVPDTEKIVAWKNNLFDFEDSDLDDVMHQLERWYDIDVVYEGQKPSVQFTGKINRNMTLNNLLMALEVSGVKCRLEDRKLIVFP